MISTDSSQSEGPAGGLEFSVVVVAWRRDRDLGECLDAVLNQTLARHRYEVIVVDNGGNPNAHASHGALVDKWYETSTNLGCSGGRNYGVQRAASNWIAFVDDDGIICRSFLSAASDVLRSDAEVAGVRGRVIARNHPILTMVAGVYDLGPDRYDRVVLDCEGCSAIRRDVFLQCGGFNEQLAGGEGLDWTVRMMHTFPGMRVVYEPSMTMRHDYVDSARRFLSKAHMNRRGRHRSSSLAEQFPNLRPASGTFQFDDVPDRRPWLARLISRLGMVVFASAAWIPEIKSDERR